MSLLIVVALPNHKTHNKGRYTGIDVHHGATGKVERTHLLQEAASPNPVGHGKIGYDDPQNGEHHIALELYALGKGTEDKRRGNEGKHTLEHGERKLWYAGRRNAVDGYTLEESLVESAHKEPSP